MPEGPDKLIKALQQIIPEVHFDNLGFADTLDFLSKNTGTNIFPNWRALEATGIDRNTPINFHFRKVKLSKILDTILRDVGGGVIKLAYSAHENVITITTADDLIDGIANHDLTAAVNPGEQLATVDAKRLDPGTQQPFAEKSSSCEFAVALSFPGEWRHYIQELDNCLTQQLSEEKIFYDDRFKERLARPNLDTYLQNIYHNQSELICIFLCADYGRKEWCGLEWRVVREIIKKRRDKDLMFFRFDDTQIDGVLSIDGYIDARSHSPIQIANLILKRLENNRKNH